MGEPYFTERVREVVLTRLPELGVREVVSVDRLSGGLSFETYTVSTRMVDGPGRLILRREPTGGPLAPYDIGFEAEIYRSLAGSSVPVPEVYLHEPDTAVLDRPFVIAEFVPGEAFVHSSARFDDAGMREEVLGRFVEMLARVHTVPVEGLPCGPGGVGTGAGDEVRHWRQRFAEVELSPRPIIRRVLDVLEEHAPRDHPQALVHGDFRLSNLLWRDGEIACVLDWERSFIGDPLADVAFTRNKALAGWCRIGGPAAERYTELTGYEIDPRRILFWQLVELVKVVYVGMASAASLARGGTTDLRLLSVANASTAVEPAMVRLVDALVSGAKEGAR
ncbi:phosphotransferase family protein [Streptomyces sp. NBC_01320]|uniref:phosphotransferase family protein n=1 Tax=Streptomyces sp. NBC_01320 TaxID=2903824 RepID=UPI002E1502F6|nr:phosphotransferase family protein [Streptomyces sp. NBC_01320]